VLWGARAARTGFRQQDILQPGVPELHYMTASNLAGVWVIIPALNEEASLPLVLADLPAVGGVIVADNGSTDSTADVARAAGAIVVDQPLRGYGAACLAGMQHLAERIEEGHPAPEIVVFLDADYSDHPEILPELIQPIASGRYDFVLGSRLTGKMEPGAMPPQSYYGNQLACFLLWLLFGARQTDLGPFRAVDYQSLCDLQMRDTNFGWTVEMQIKARRARLRTCEIPVPYRRRVGDSKISGTISGTIKASYKILYTIARYGIVRR